MTKIYNYLNVLRLYHSTLKNKNARKFITKLKKIDKNEGANV